MPSTKNWWAAEIDWSTPAGQLLQKFLAALPKDRPFHVTVYGSAPLQLTIDRQLLSGDVDLFSDDDEDLSAFITASKLDKTHGSFYLEPGFELSFRRSPRWRLRAKTVQRGNVTLTLPHPLDILRPIHSRNLRQNASPAERPVARRRRSRGCGRADGDDVRPKPARHQPQQDRRPEGRTPRTVRDRVRQTGGEGDGVGEGALNKD